MLIQKYWRIFFLIASLLFAQHAAALHVYAHLNQPNTSAQQFDQAQQDSDPASQKWCELCLTLAELGNGITSTSAPLALLAVPFHFSAVDHSDLSPRTQLPYRSRAPPAL
jgi:hypothetical protein